MPELVQESNSEDETTERSTDSFADSTDEDMDSDIYEIGDEFVKTFSFDMIVDRNPIYLGMAGISTATGIILEAAYTMVNHIMLKKVC